MVPVEAAEYTIILLGKTAVDPSGSLQLLAQWTVEAVSAARDSAGAVSAEVAAGSAAAPVGGAGTESARSWFTEYATL